MRPIDVSEIKNIADYEMEREHWRPVIMALKDRRRIEVGEHVIFLFENRDTVRYQIQEMMRVERIVKSEGIQHEVETYNELIPRDGGLSATMLIAYASVEDRTVMLHALLGLENHVWLEIPGTPRIPARFDTRQIATDRISSVQYVKFRLAEEQVRRWREGAKLVIDHPKYHSERPLNAAELNELSHDLSS